MIDDINFVVPLRSSVRRDAVPVFAVARRPARPHRIPPMVPAVAPLAVPPPRVQWGASFQNVLHACALSALCTAAFAQTLNPTGRAFDLVTPVVQDGLLIGDAALRIGANDALSVNAEGMVGLLGARINPETANTIRSFADVEGRVSLSVFEQAGAALKYDPASLSLNFVPARRALAEQSFSLAEEPVRSENYIEPAAVSGYVNFVGGVQYESGTLNGVSDTGFELDDIEIEGAVRAFDTVVEGRARYDEEDQTIYSDFTRVVYDDVDSGNRYIAGDYSTSFAGLVDGSDLLGVAIENTGELRPFENLRPRGRTSFEIERTSTVEIYTNGILERRVRLEPGIFDLDDIPLASGGNAVSVVVEDELGRREIASFDQFFDVRLLGQGETLYSAAAGIVSDATSEEPDYDVSRPAFSGQIEYGLTDTVTIGTAARVTPESGIVGASVATATEYGFFDLDVAGSYNTEDSTSGVAAELQWSHSFDNKRRIAPRDPDDPFAGFRDGTISAKLGVRSEGFNDGDPFDLSQADAEYVFDAEVNYFQPLTGDTHLSLGAFYGKAANSFGSDRYELSASVGGWLNERITWNLRGAYVMDDNDADEGLSVGLQVGMRFGENTRASAFYDSADNRFGGSLRYTNGRRGVGAYSAGFTTDMSDDDNVGVTASASYTGNRFIGSATHREDYDPDTGDRSGTTSLRVGTGIAFADGNVAVGRPISGAFVIARRHDNLADNIVTLGQRGENYEAKSGALGPALSSGYGAYRNASVATDVEDLPLGYDLGAGLVEVEPPYKAGYYVEIGSDNQVTLTGNLLDGSGEPLGLATGTARNIDYPDAPLLQVFTNRSGRFALLGAQQGMYRIEMSNGTSVDVEAPIGSIGLVRVGDVRVD